jgi:hypothetical protein
MANILPEHEISELQTTSVREVRHWFENHPTVQSCFPEEHDINVMEKIIRFMGWLRLYLEDEHHGRDQAVNEIASMQKCSRDLAWLWVNSDKVSDTEILDIIRRGADDFHESVGFCYVYHASKCKEAVARIEEPIRTSFLDLQLPRAYAEWEQNHEVVPPAEVPPTDDELSSDATDGEAIDGNITENI